MAVVRITEFTDPACPWAYSAEPFRRRLDWLYGEDLVWHVRMVGLSESPEEYGRKGFTPERLSGAYRRIAHDHGMPIDTALRPRMTATVPACRAVVAARREAPDLMRPLLRRLRVRCFRGELLDERLANWSGGRRYTCPSYEIERIADGTRIAVPGFQPFQVYDVITANLLPGVRRAEPPESAEEVLRWTGTPLASKEVAVVRDIPLEDAREELGRVAEEEHVGADGFWFLPGHHPYGG